MQASVGMLHHTQVKCFKMLMQTPIMNLPHISPTSKLLHEFYTCFLSSELICCLLFSYLAYSYHIFFQRFLQTLAERMVPKLAKNE